MSRPAAFPLRTRLPLKARRHVLFPFAWRTPVLLVPGLHDSGPDHWQSRWQQSHDGFLRVAQADYATPDIDRWAATVAEAIQRSPVPPVVAAHSFGCLATVRAVTALGAGIAGALLVAPADPDRLGIPAAALVGGLGVPTTVVASTNDPWLKVTKAGAWATSWGSRLVVLPDAGHINAESGHHAWPEGLALLRDLGERAAAAGVTTVRRSAAAGGSRSAAHVRGL